MSGTSPVTRAALLFSGCLVMALGLSELSLQLLRDPALHTSVWWPLVGFGVAILARRPPREWPAAVAGLALGLSATNLDALYSPLVSAGLVVTNCTEMCVIAALARRWFPRGPVLDSPARAARFALCSVGGLVLGACLFTAVQAPLVGAPVALWTGYLRTHALGLFLVTPLFLADRWPRGPAADLFAELRRTRVNLEWAAQFTAVGLTASLIFVTDQVLLPAFVCVVPLAWGGLRLGPRRALSSLLLMALITTVGTLRGGGPLVPDPPADRLLALQIVLAAATACTLYVVLAAQDRQTLLARAQEQLRELADAERISGLGSSTWNLDTGETRWSEGMYEQLGLAPPVRPSAAVYLDAVHPDDRRVLDSVLARVPDTGVVPELEYRLRRPDGSERIMLNRSRTVPGPDGRPLHLRATVLDVTATRRAEAALQQAHQRLTGVVDAVEGVAIVGMDPATGRIAFFSRGAERMLGWRADEVVGIHTPLIYHQSADLQRASAETGVEDPLQALGEAMIRTGQASRRWVCLRKDGSEFSAQGSLSQFPGPDGEPELFVAVIVDLTPVLRAEAELQESEDRFRLAFDFAPMAMAIVAMDDGDPGRILRVNPALCRFTGITERALIGRRLADLMTPAHAEAAAADLHELLARAGDSITGERAFHRGDGGELWGLLSTSVVRPADGRDPYLITMIEDITARMQLTERLRHEAAHDPLTGLPNRQVLRRRMEDALEAGDPSRGAVAVLYVDLDGFKAVNDSLGHAAGDELLVQVADRIAACVRVSDVVARLGGDEFAVLLPRVGYLETARAIGDRIVGELARRFEIDGAYCRIGASIGIALSVPEDTAPDLLNAADQAMYEAKRCGKGRVEMSVRAG